MRRYIALFVFCFLILTTSFTTRVFPQNYSNVEKVTQSNTQFAIDLYKKIKIKEGNLFFSPYSISTALAMTYGGARGETAKQIAAVLHLSLENEELLSAFAEIQTKLNAIQQKEKIQLNIANSLWPQDKYPFLREYLELAKNFYQTEITPVDYITDSEAATATVGGGCFPSGTEVLSPGGPLAIETVDSGKMVYTCDLATGEWALKKVLKRQSFQYEGDMIAIQTGHITIQATGNHPFYVLRGGRLPFRPQPRDVPKKEQGMKEHGRWVEARDLKEGDVLKDKGGEGLIITSLSNQHEMTKVYNLDVEGYHNYAVHQKGILVHNKGGKEASPEIFRADHPFLFLIQDNLTGSILFMGRLSNPSVE